MSEGVVAEVADRLWQAEIDRSPIRPITDTYPELVIEDAYEDFRFRLPDVVADNASGSRIVLGPRARVPADLVDLRLLGCVLRAQGDVVATAAGGAVMGHPAAAVAWLVNRLSREDWPLGPGTLVLSGGLTAPVPVRPGSVVSAEFDGLGTVDVYS